MNLATYRTLSGNHGQDNKSIRCFAYESFPLRKLYARSCQAPSERGSVNHVTNSRA